MKLSKVKLGQAFKECSSSTDYYIRGKGNNGRIKCRCYTRDHQRYTWMDRAFKKDKEVEPIKL